MYQSDKEAAIEFVRGAGLVILIMGVFFVFILTLGEFEPKPIEKFEIVDHYGTCAVVRYNPKNRAEGVYFLACGNENHLRQH